MAALEIHRFTPDDTEDVRTSFEIINAIGAADAPWEHPWLIDRFEGFLRNEMLSAVVSSVYWKTVFFLLAAGGLAALYVTRLRRPSLYLVYPLALATLLPLRLIEHRYGLPAFVMLLVCREDDPPAVEYAGVALGALLSGAAVYVLARGLWLL